MNTEQKKIQHPVRKRPRITSNQHLNIVGTPTHHHTPATLQVQGLGTITLRKPEPIFDKVTVSAWSEENLYNIFVEKFGRPYPWSAIDGYFCFKNGVFLSTWWKKGWRSIIFKLDQSVVTELYPVLDDLPERLIGKMDTPEDYRNCREEPAALLQEVELAFDIPLPKMRYITQAEPLLHDIASTILVKRQFSYAHPIPLDKNKRKRLKTYDGTVNGKVTYYIDKLEETEQGNFVKIRL